MADKSPYDTITSYRKRQKYGPVIISGLALLLITTGLFFLWLWLSGRTLDSLSFNIQPPVPTRTMRPTVTLVPTRTTIPPETAVPTSDTSATALVPFQITIIAGDTLVDLAAKYGLDPDFGVLLIWDYNGWEIGHIIQPGEEITIPHPDAILFTPTPISSNLASGTLILYRVLPGDSLAFIAEEYLSTVDAILDANDIENPDQIGIGDWLLIPVNLVTPVPTPSFTVGPPPSITPDLPATPIPTATPTP